MATTARHLHLFGKARGRRVGVAVDPRGGPPIAGDVGGTLWRASYAGG